MRKTLIGVGIIGLVLVSIAVVLVLWNNRPVAAPERSELVASQDRAIGWLMANRDQIVEWEDPLLWWMVKRSAEISKEPALAELYESFKARAFRTGYHNNMPWRPLFDVPWDREPAADLLLQLSDYNLLILFGLTCHSGLGELEVVQFQQHANFCGKHHPFSPACRTHQLLGVLFVEESGCMNSAELNPLKDTLQAQIRRQLTWDPRVLDIYMQRVLLLAYSGAHDRIKPVWLQRVLDAQYNNGGWSNFQPLLPVGGGRSVGFSGRGISLRTPKSNFHTTAQGLFLTTLLLANE